MGVLPRLRFGPVVPPANTKEGLTFTLRFTVGLIVIFLVVGFIYATGIGKNHQTLGILLFACAVACLYPCWLLVRIRRKVRAQSPKRGGDIANPS